MLSIIKGVLLMLAGYSATYSLSDLIELTAFSSFSPQKVRFCLPNLADLLGALPRVCINILFITTPQNVDFVH